MAIEQWDAHVQYDAMTGTVALDNADFERWETILGIEGWLPLGLRFYFVHPGLGAAGKAESSSSYLKLWAIEWDRLRNGYSLPDLLQQERPIKVTEFSFVMEDVLYPEPSNAAAVLLRGSKRLSIAVWDAPVQKAGVDEDDFEVVEERAFSWQDGQWTESRET